MRMGSSYVNVGDGGPDDVLNLALRVMSAGDDFSEQARSLANAIHEIEQGHPWGDHDKYASAFLKNYTDTPEGSHTAANDAVRTSLGDSGDALSHIGSTVVETMAKYSVTDQGSGSDLSKLHSGKAEKAEMVETVAKAPGHGGSANNSQSA
ncbi:hypothetical protein [Rugosimonospora africana]|uniref:Uncharacterized protein n=1 Tax=Rugosimonospora africana TaxID=556532 RepID=A0A8J3VSK1_9ACTN|nr:hypothetical protein [Rugosimonospora africana]GIH16558.1 hypothetical protein Raf01_47300 [Rugosimonospora africana]